MATGGGHKAEQKYGAFTDNEANVATPEAKTTPSSSPSSFSSFSSLASSPSSSSLSSSPTHDDETRRTPFLSKVTRSNNPFSSNQVPSHSVSSLPSPYGTGDTERRSEASFNTAASRKPTQSTANVTQWDKDSQKKVETEACLPTSSGNTGDPTAITGTRKTSCGTPVTSHSSSTSVTVSKTPLRSSHPPGSSAPNQSGTQGACSVTCANNFIKISKELRETKDQLFALSVQMAEQSSHISKLMEENRRYIRENGKLKKKSSSRSNATVLTPNNFDHFGSGGGPLRNVDGGFDHTDEVLTELQDRVMALQIHNDELNVCLEREKRRRREAEARVERDEGYIKRLEDNVQTLRGTRVVMDSNAYRQLAEAYMASRRPAARRPHSHSHQGSDLVCDSSNTSLNLPGMPLQTSSCPSSPKSDFSAPSTPSSHLYQDPQLFPAASRRNGSIRGPKERSSSDRSSRALGSGTMSPWDYQQLLENLENLDGTNRGALS